MSWSISCIGKPAAIIAHMAKYNETLNGASKEEFEAALPFLSGMLNQNSYVEGDTDKTPMINFVASGSGYKTDTVKSLSCNVKMEPIYNVVV